MGFSTNNIGNGRDENFFPVRSEKDFDDLKLWLSSRHFTDITRDEGFTDRTGKPMVGLLFKTKGADGKMKFKKRGIVWFKDAFLRDDGISIIESFFQQSA